MTERIKGLVVALNQDIRDDDVEAIVHAVMMVRGVQAVTKSVCDYNDWMNRARIYDEIRKKLWEVLADDRTKAIVKSATLE